MNSTISNPSSANEISSIRLDEHSRCLHRFANGKRCRLLASGSQSGLCAHHFRLGTVVAVSSASSQDSADLSADLLPDLSIHSSVDLRQFLARLLVLVTQGRISTRRAAVLSYIVNQLLHSPSRVKRNRAASRLLSPQPRRGNL